MALRSWRCVLYTTVMLIEQKIFDFVKTLSFGELRAVRCGALHVSDTLPALLILIESDEPNTLQGDASCDAVLAIHVFANTQEQARLLAKRLARDPANNNAGLDQRETASFHAFWLGDTIERFEADDASSKFIFVATSRYRVTYNNATDPAE